MFDVLSIAFLVIVIISCIVGYFRGFLALLVGLLKGLVAVVLAAMLCKPMGNALNTTKMGTGIADKVENYLIEKDETFKFELTKESKEIYINEQLDQKLEEAKIPQVLRKYVKNILVDRVQIEEGETTTVARYIGKGMSFFVCTIVAYIIIFAIILILLTIVQRLFKNINKIPIVGLANRLLGLGLGVIIALLVIGVICYVLTFLMTVPGDMSNWIMNTLKLTEEQKDEQSLAKFMYEHNVIKWALNIMFA